MYLSMRRLPDNSLAMDVAILEVAASYEVGFCFMPLPKKAEKAEPKPAPSSTYGGWQPGRRNQQQPYAKGPGKNSPKGKGKSKRAAAVIPKELQGRDNVSIDPQPWGVAQEFPMVVSVAEVSTCACDVDVTLRILKQSIRARTKELASLLDYMKGFTKLLTGMLHWLIA